MELLHDFCHRKMKLVMSVKAELTACMFSGWFYKWKSVAFQLKEKKSLLPFQPLFGKTPLDTFCFPFT